MPNRTLLTLAGGASVLSAVLSGLGLAGWLMPYPIPADAPRPFLIAGSFIAGMAWMMAMGVVGMGRGASADPPAA